MAPDFSPEKGNRVYIAYESAILKKISLLRHGLSFIRRSFPFSSTPLQKGEKLVKEVSINCNGF